MTLVLDRACADCDLGLRCHYASVPPSDGGRESGLAAGSVNDAHRKRTALRAVGMEGTGTNPAPS